jgi:gluconate 2-dehydrogenase gamma chain
MTSQLTEQQQQTMRALLDCLIPPDDFPGAWDAGVGEFVTRLFESDLASQLQLYRSGLDAVEAESLTRFDTSFCRLTPDQRSIVLLSIESGHVLTSWPIPRQQFFDLLINTTAEGFYSDPQQGGNRGAISWVMTGFEDHKSS